MSEIEIGNFFSFLAAMMLAYQPVRALSTMNMILKQGLSAANRILPIIDNQNKITDLMKTLRILILPILILSLITLTLNIMLMKKMF